MNGKILTLDKTPTGMQHLVDQANPRPQPKEENPGYPAGKCLKVRVVLDATDYYVPDGVGGFSPQPPFPFEFPLAYSEVREGTKVIGVIKHQDLRIMSTGLKTEAVDLPSWWERRDDGII